MTQPVSFQGNLPVKQAVGQLARNGKTALQNSLDYQLQNPGRLKTNAFILSALVLVVTRILIANHSALIARGTPEERYRQREAVRTTIREIGGWSLSYGLLKVIQRHAQRALEKAFDIVRAEPYPVFRELGRSARSFFRPYEVRRVTPDVMTRSFEYGNKARWEQWLPKLEKWGLTRLGLNSVERLHKWVPIVVGSIPAVILSGFLLERFTRDRSQEVADVITRHLHGDDDPPPVYNAQLQQQRFRDYMDHIRQQQMQRGGSVRT